MFKISMYYPSIPSLTRVLGFVFLGSLLHLPVANAAPGPIAGSLPILRVSGSPAVSITPATLDESHRSRAVIPTRLKFEKEPRDTEAGETMNEIIVHAEDGRGDPDRTFNGNVTIAIGTNPGGGTLSGTTTVAAVNGTATFRDLSINKAADDYTLIASANVPITGDINTTSDSFDIEPGDATQLVFSQQPTDTETDATIAPPVTVRALDAFGNLDDDFDDDVTIAIGTNPAGGTLSGEIEVEADDGVATFDDLSIDNPGNGYTLTASARGVSGATSDPFDITSGPATQLEFGQQPSGTPAGATIAPPVTVRALDNDGNVDTSFSGSVTVAIGINPSGGILSGTTSIPAVNGIATFNDLSIDNAGNGYTLTAKASGLAGATSGAFDITAATATQLAFGQQPSDTAAGATITPPIIVRALDQSGNLITTFNGNVSIAIGTNPAGGSLSGTTTVAAVNGVATFGDLRIDKAGDGYTLIALASGLTSATSDPLDITAPAASRLEFGQQPSDTSAVAAITPPVTVRALDSSGNLITSFSGNVTISIGTNPVGGSLSGTTTVAAVNGVATFSNLRIDKAGNGYTLLASAAGLTSATSASFDIVATSAASLAFDQQPINTQAGASITPAVTVRALDGSGNLAATFTGSVTIAIGANPAGGTLSGTTAVAAVGGIATFSNLRIDRVGTGYMLLATAAGLASATSAPFSIVAGGGSAATSTITANPTSLPADGTSTSTITVQIRDAGDAPRTVGGENVQLTTTAGTLGAVQDNQNGTYTALLTAPMTAGTATISGTLNGSAIIDTATVDFTGAVTDLAVTATVSDPTPAIGESIVYTITVTNQGSARATGVEVTDQLPARLGFVSARVSQGSYDAQGKVWSVGTLEPGANASLEITARVQ
jgi:uncharacterized repeat protein (TIGR01451 family)